MGLATDHGFNKVKKVGTSLLVENLVKNLRTENSRYLKSGNGREILDIQDIGEYRTRMGKVI